MRSLYSSLLMGAASLAWLVMPSDAGAQFRTFNPGPRVTFNGATRVVPFPNSVVVPPRIVPSTVQSNLNYWAYGTYPNLINSSNFVNPYAMYYSAYNPYMMNYGYNPYLSS